MPSNKSDKLDKLYKLNEKFYNLYGRLHENFVLFDDEKTRQIFAANLLEQYKAEYALLKIETETVDEPLIYEALLRHNALVPRRRFIFFRNRAQKLIDREVMFELDEFFRKKEQALERLIEALDDADGAENATTAFEEPQAKPAEHAADAPKPKRSRKPKSSEPKDPPPSDKTPPDDGQIKGQLSIDELSSADK